MKGKWFFKLLFFIFLFNEKNIQEHLTDLTDYQENQNHSGKKSDRPLAELDFKVQALFLSLSLNIISGQRKGVKKVIPLVFTRLAASGLASWRVYLCKTEATTIRVIARAYR